MADKVGDSDVGGESCEGGRRKKIKTENGAQPGENQDKERPVDSNTPPGSGQKAGVRATVEGSRMVPPGVQATVEGSRTVPPEGRATVEGSRMVPPGGRAKAETSGPISPQLQRTGKLEPKTNQLPDSSKWIQSFLEFKRTRAASLKPRPDATTSAQSVPIIDLTSDDEHVITVGDHSDSDGNVSCMVTSDQEDDKLPGNHSNEKTMRDDQNHHSIQDTQNRGNQGNSSELQMEAQGQTKSVDEESTTVKIGQTRKSCNNGLLVGKNDVTSADVTGINNNVIGKGVDDNTQSRDGSIETADVIAAHAPSNLETLTEIPPPLPQQQTGWNPYTAVDHDSIIGSSMAQTTSVPQSQVFDTTSHHSVLPHPHTPAPNYLSQQPNFGNLSHQQFAVPSFFPSDQTNIPVSNQVFLPQAPTLVGNFNHPPASAQISLPQPPSLGMPDAAPMAFPQGPTLEGNLPQLPAPVPQFPTLGNQPRQQAAVQGPLPQQTPLSSQAQSSIWRNLPHPASLSSTQQAQPLPSSCTNFPRPPATVVTGLMPHASTLGDLTQVSVPSVCSTFANQPQAQPSGSVPQVPALVLPHTQHLGSVPPVSDPVVLTSNPEHAAPDPRFLSQPSAPGVFPPDPSTIAISGAANQPQRPTLHPGMESQPQSHGCRLSMPASPYIPPPLGPMYQIPPPCLPAPFPPCIPPYFPHLPAYPPAPLYPFLRPAPIPPMYPMAFSAIPPVHNPGYPPPSLPQPGQAPSGTPSLFNPSVSMGTDHAQPPVPPLDTQNAGQQTEDTDSTESGPESDAETKNSAHETTEEQLLQENTAEQKNSQDRAQQNTTGRDATTHKDAGDKVDRGQSLAGQILSDILQNKYVSFSCLLRADIERVTKGSHRSKVKTGSERSQHARRSQGQGQDDAEEDANLSWDQWIKAWNLFTRVYTGKYACRDDMDIYRRILEVMKDTGADWRKYDILYRKDREQKSRSLSQGQDQRGQLEDDGHHIAREERGAEDIGEMHGEDAPRWVEYREDLARDAYIDMRRRLADRNRNQP